MKAVTEILTTLIPKLEEGPQKESVTVNVEKWAEWAEFDLREGSKDERQMRMMIVKCAEFVKRMKAKDTPYWLSLLGTSGGGKTMLAKRIFRWHSNSGLFQPITVNGREGMEICYPRDWCWWPKLAGMLKSNEGYGILRELESAQFSVIDEIGAELDKSGHVTNCLSNALCARVGKWTIITSNKSLGEIERDLDPRVASRMIRDGSEVVDVNVEDYSLWKKRQK